MAIDPSYAINFIVESFEDPNVIPSPEDIGHCVDELFLSPSLAGLRDKRQLIIDEVLRRLTTKIGAATFLENNEGHEEWLSAVTRESWRFWPRLYEYLQHVKGFPRDILVELNRSTDFVLGRLESPKRPGPWDRRGLVFGHVQSGKTTHYTALVAKALDSGYQVIIVLAGIHKSLRSQTHERLDHYLLGRDSAWFIEAVKRGVTNAGTRLVGVGKRDQDLGMPAVPTVITLTSSADNGDFSSTVAGQIGLDLEGDNRLVLVIKKHPKILENLLRWLDTLHAHSQLDRQHYVPTLVIDDEADHASLDTGDDPDAEPRRINGLIRRLLLAFGRVGFVGYTATPFANIFIPPDIEHEDFGRDLFPEHFVLNLKSPPNHIGPSAVFGNPGDDSIGVPPQDPLPMYNEVSDASQWMPDKHRKTHEPGPLPQSLIDALLKFVLACAARHCRGQIDVHNSMLVHVTRFVDVQGKVHAQISREMETWKNILAYSNGNPLKTLENAMQKLWCDDFAEHYEVFASRFPDQVSPLPQWKEVWSKVPVTIQRIQVQQVNGSVDDALSYTRTPNGLYVIAVGGDKLSRGLTLEGLTISYFMRTSRIYDTLMQMGRWFGYRPGYVDLCRVCAPINLRNRFREISLAIEELRNDLDFMAEAHMSPRAFGLRLRMPSDGLLVTSPDKIRSGQDIMVRFAGELVQTLIMPRGAYAKRNRVAVNTLIGDIARSPERTVRGEQSSHLVWSNVPSALVMKFLSEYEAFHTPCFCRRCDGLRKFIAAVLGRGELTEWTVVIISKRKPKDEKFADIGGNKVALVTRDRQDTSTGERFETQAVVGSADEALDLSQLEYDDAVNRTRNSAVNGVDVRTITAPKREYTREARPPTRGLILIYPIADDQDPETDCTDCYVPALAVSFPKRLAAGAVGYRVTDDWLRQHGALDDWEET